MVVEVILTDQIVGIKKSNQDQSAGLTKVVKNRSTIIVLNTGWEFRFRFKMRPETIIITTETTTVILGVDITILTVQITRVVDKATTKEIGTITMWKEKTTGTKDTEAIDSIKMMAIKE